FSISATAAQDRSPSVDGKQWCGTWLRERHASSPRLHLYEMWVVKYVAGDNWPGIVGRDFSAKVNAEGMLRWVDNYCREHPVNNVQRAAEQLIIELIVRSMLPKFAAVSPVPSA